MAFVFTPFFTTYTPKQYVREGMMSYVFFPFPDDGILWAKFAEYAFATRQDLDWKTGTELFDEVAMREHRATIQWKSHCALQSMTFPSEGEFMIFKLRWS